MVTTGVTLKFRVYEKIRGLSLRALDPLKNQWENTHFTRNKKNILTSRGPWKQTIVSIRFFGNQAKN